MTKEEIFQVVKEITLEILDELDPEQITINQSLKNLGANSIDRADIVTNTLEKLQLKIPLVELGGAKDLAGLVEILHQKITE